MGDVTEDWAQTLRSDGRVAFGQRRARSVRMALLCVLFVLVGAWLAATSTGPGVIAGWMAIVFFGGGAVLLTFQVVQARPSAPPVLVVDESGVRAFRGGIEVPWSAVEDTFVFSHRGNHSVQLVLEQEFAESWYAGLGSANRRLALANRRFMGDRPVASLPAMVDADPEALAEWLLREATARR